MNSAANGCDVRDLAVGADVKPVRIVHPAVDGDHRTSSRESRRGDDEAAQEVRPRRQPVPAVDVDRDEDRLDEEREALDREGEAEDLAPTLHELRPQQAELEREDRAGDDADREEDQHHLRPALGERLVDRVAGPQVQPLHEEDDRRERDPEADQRDVDAERERLHLPGLEQVGLHATFVERIGGCK